MKESEKNWSVIGNKAPSLPALVGNKRVHRGVGDVLVITYQETALLLLPATVLEGPPQKRRSSMAF